MNITFPWPPKVLNPNSRSHWAVKAKAVKQYRDSCVWIAKGVHMLRPDGPAILSLTFCPPDKRRRDDDNCISSFKAGRDGIAEALGIDDSQLSLLVTMGKPVNGGAVIVEIIEKESA